MRGLNELRESICQKIARTFDRKLCSFVSHNLNLLNESSDCLTKIDNKHTKKQEQNESNKETTKKLTKFSANRWKSIRIFGFDWRAKDENKFLYLKKTPTAEHLRIQPIENNKKHPKIIQCIYVLNVKNKENNTFCINNVFTPWIPPSGKWRLFLDIIIHKTSYCGETVNALDDQQCILEYYSREKTRLNCWCWCCVDLKFLITL